MAEALEFAGLGVHGEAGDGVVAAVGGVDEFAIDSNLNVGAGIFVAVKTLGQGADGVEGFKLAVGAVKGIGSDAIAAFIIEIHDGQLGMKGKVSRLQTLGGVTGEGFVFAELAGFGVKTKLIDGVGAGVGDVGEGVGGVNKYGVGASGSFDAA